MGNYACIGWGSLIWDARDLPIQGAWNRDGPHLGVEFLRRSGGERLTLVLSDTAPLVQTQWALLDVNSLSDAVAVMRRREGTKSDWIGRWPSTAMSSAEEAIGAWAEGHKLKGVVWTAIPPKWNDTDGEAPTVAEAISWLGSLGDGEGRAREYIEKAPASVRTPYREAFERELGWLPRPSA